MVRKHLFSMGCACSSSDGAAAEEPAASPPRLRPIQVLPNPLEIPELDEDIEAFNTPEQAPRRTPSYAAASAGSARAAGMPRPQIVVPPPMLVEALDGTPRTDVSSIVSPPANRGTPRAAGFDLSHRQAGDSPRAASTPRQAPRYEWTSPADPRWHSPAASHTGHPTKMVAQFEAMVRRVHYPDRQPSSASHDLRH